MRKNPAQRGFLLLLTLVNNFVIVSTRSSFIIFYYGLHLLGFNSLKVATHNGFAHEDNQIYSMKTKIGLLTLLASSALVQATPSDSVAFDLDFKSYYYSEYVSPFGRLLYDGLVVQSEATIWAKFRDLPGKFYIVSWASTSFEGWNANKGTEMDYSMGWKGDIGNGVNLNLWVTYLDLLPVGTMPGKNDQVRLFVELDRKFAYESLLFTPFVRFEVPHVVHNCKDRSGLRVYAGVRTAWEFAPKWFLSNKTSLLFDDGATGLQPGTFFDFKISLSWQATEWLSIEPLNFRWITPLTSVSDGRKTWRILGIGATAKL